MTLLIKAVVISFAASSAKWPPAEWPITTPPPQCMIAARTSSK